MIRRVLAQTRAAVTAAEIVDEMRKDDDASHNQLISWAIDADRLMQARILLGNVDLE